VRVLRSTLFPPPVKGSAPITTVLIESNVTEPFEKVIAGAVEVDLASLVVFDLFDVPEATSIVEATFEAQRRMEATGKTERHMATMFHWDAMAIEASRPGGVVSMTKPSPLPEADVRYVLIKLSRHPAYGGHAVVAICDDWTILGMRHGRVGKLGPNARPLLEGAREKVATSGAMSPRDEALVREIDLALGTTN
jgi:hypothetical protein